jgi:hypothetical protein
MTEISNCVEKENDITIEKKNYLGTNIANLLIKNELGQ